MRRLSEFILKIKSVPNRFYIGVIFLFAFIVYANTLLNGFVLDDLVQIIANPNIQSLSNILKFFSGSTVGIFYRPILSLAFAINFAIWQDNAFGFHLFSILLHGVNASLIFLLFKRLFSLEKAKNNNLLAFILSLIFVVHPANTESIAYISSIQEPLYIFFFLTAFLLVISWLNNKKSGLKKLFLINALVMLSLLSKESGLLTIPVVLLFVYLFSKNKFKYATISFTLTFLFYLFLRLVITKVPISLQANIPPIFHATFVERLLTVPYELFSYMRLIFFPKDLFYSQQFIIKSVTNPRFYVSLPIIVIVASIFITFSLKLKSKLYIFFLIWVALSFSMLLNIYPLDASLAERWLYGPFVGVLGTLGILILHIPQKYNKFKLILCIISILLLPIFAIRTVNRNMDWKDSITLISHDLKLNPDSPELLGDYGSLLGSEGDLIGSKKYIEKSIELSPTSWNMYFNLAVINEKEQNFKKAKELYLLIIKNINDPVAYENLAVLTFKTENPKAALDFATTGLKYYPDNPTLNLIAALSYYKLGDKTNAITFAKKTYYLYPSNQTFTTLQRITKDQSVDNLLK